MSSSWYERHILSPALDFACGLTMISRQRQLVVPLARGQVLAPGGQLLFCEHGRAPDESVRRWQARLQPLWGRLAGGCHLGRDIPALLQEAGFSLADLHTRYLPGPRPFTFHYWGETLPV